MSCHIKEPFDLFANQNRSKKVLKVKCFSAFCLFIAVILASVTFIDAQKVFTNSLDTARTTVDDFNNFEQCMIGTALKAKFSTISKAKMGWCFYMAWIAMWMAVVGCILVGVAACS